MKRNNCGKIIEIRTTFYVMAIVTISKYMITQHIDFLKKIPVLILTEEKFILDLISNNEPSY